MVRIFVDFDGTITLRDVGDALFEHFGGAACAGIIREYRDGLMSAAECFRRECAACAELETASLDAFLDAQEIDPGFADFVGFCRQRALPLTILSDGMDYYIRRILHRFGLGDVPFAANHLELAPVAAHPGGLVRFEPSFPSTDEVCDRCACCKRNHIVTQAADDDIIVYCGEGYSDRCPARFADCVFAKDDLLAFCRREQIAAEEYRTFADIEARLRAMLGKPGKRPALRKRRRAALARRDVFIAE